MEAFWVIAVISGAFLLFILSKQASYNRQRKEQEQRAAERKRIEECGEIVLYFANQLGYIARQAISREELEQLIDSGVEPGELAEQIMKRLEAIDGLVLGAHQLGEVQLPVKLTQDFRDRHVYVVGKSGSGKTTLLRNMIIQDLWRGNGLGVIAPEQEMITEEILPFIPEHRLDDVVYFNPADLQNPVCFNPLQLEAGEDIDLKVDEILTIFKRVVGDGTGSRMDEILRQAFYALMETTGSTLLDIPPLLDRENPHFRKQIISQLKDEATIRFWRDVYPQFPKDAHLPIMHRLGKFTRPKVIRNLLCQRKGSINFRQLMDTGKVMLFNLSDGILGELNSQLLGQLIVSKFQLAVMSRADTPQHQRRRFYLYIDEFQTFTSTANASYDKILSRARKYRLALILAHQQTGQIPSDLLRQIFGNVSTMVSFVVSSDDARRLSKEFVSEYNGEITMLPFEKLLSLGVGQTYCKIARNSFPMRTFPVSEKPDFSLARAAIERSRRLYGVGRGLAAKEQPGKQDEQTFDDTDPAKVF